MFKVLVVMTLMAVAQLLPSCGDSAGEGGASAPGQIVGWIDEKRTHPREVYQYFFVINGQEYGVPYEFWLEAKVGDLVKYDGNRWTFVRRR
jgi:hypothetical protein